MQFDCRSQINDSHDHIRKPTIREDHFPIVRLLQQAVLIGSDSCCFNVISSSTLWCRCNYWHALKPNQPAISPHQQYIFAQSFFRNLIYKIVGSI